MLLDVTGYFKLYLDISNFRGLAAFILFLFCFLLLFFFGAREYRRMIF